MSRLHEQRPDQSIPVLCALLGMSKQAYYQHRSRSYIRFASYDIILQLVADIRRDLPRIGGRKLHAELLKRLPVGLSIGRDTLFNLLRVNGYLLRSRHGDVPHTTDSSHRFHTYKNLIVGYIPTAPNQLYVCDITYIRTVENRFYYLSLITDAFSHKIVGWCLLDTLETEGPLKALDMALSALPSGSRLIHHSDRGTQYCCNEYVDKLHRHGITISMTESGNPRDNAIAERINGILKMEWFYDMQFTTLEQSCRQVAHVIELYNMKRPHSSIGMYTPEEIHRNPIPTERKWKNYYKKKEVEEIRGQKNV